MSDASPADANAHPKDVKASPQNERGPDAQDNVPTDQQKQESQSPSTMARNDSIHSSREEQTSAAEFEHGDRGQSQAADEDTSPQLSEGEATPPLSVVEEPPPLPVGEEPPPLPDEALPDDGWDALWDDQHQAFYFSNRFTGVTQWENPRVSDAIGSGAGAGAGAPAPTAARPHGGYNPAIHGDYDPNADYAIAARAEEQAGEVSTVGVVPGASGAVVQEYAATGAFNRFTGRWQAEDQSTERHNDENKSRRQMNAYFDVDAAANSHGGKSLKAERQNKKLSKAELKAFKEKRREKKEEKRRAWLRD